MGVHWGANLVGMSLLSLDACHLSWFSEKTCAFWAHVMESKSRNILSSFMHSIYYKFNVNIPTKKILYLIH